MYHFWHVTSFHESHPFFWSKGHGIHIRNKVLCCLAVLLSLLSPKGHLSFQMHLQNSMQLPSALQFAKKYYIVLKISAQCGILDHSRPYFWFQKSLVNFIQFLSSFVNVCQLLSIFVNLWRFMSFFVNLCQFMSLFVKFGQSQSNSGEFSQIKSALIIDQVQSNSLKLHFSLIHCTCPKMRSFPTLCTLQQEPLQSRVSPTLFFYIISHVSMGCPLKNL